MKKVVYFAFQKEKMCFMHILYNMLDLHEKGHTVKLVIEGASTALVQPLIEENNLMFKKVMDLKLIDSVCKVCAVQMKAYDFIKKETQLKLVDEMFGHPPMEPYLKEGYQVITL